VGTISKYLTLGKNICNTLYTLGNLLRALQRLGIKMEWMYHNPFTGGFARAFVGGAQGAIEAGKELFKLVDRMCKWVSCRQAGNLEEKHGPGAWYAKFVDSHKINNLGQAQPGPRAADFPTATIWPADPSQSLVLSLVSLCIPGIFFNLQKARQIECQYLSCLNDQVAQGTPVFVCSKLRNYGWCRYVMGEIFQIIPFAHFFQSFAGTVQQMLSNPISLFLSIADSKWACGAWVPISGAKWGFCNLVHQVVLVGDVLADIKALKDTDWKLSGDSCKEVLDRIEEGENGESEEDI
ncbi:MAG TPA: hypothetical protein VJK52_00640, partial [Candidatus Nanoarchaeia archaeon]|nr:hypothetical protein [Candidatus Nanoarchaeia archaeon]